MRRWENVTSQLEIKPTDEMCDHNEFLNICYRAGLARFFTGDEIEEAKRVLYALKDGKDAETIVETTQHGIIKCLWGEYKKEVVKC